MKRKIITMLLCLATVIGACTTGIACNDPDAGINSVENGSVLLADFEEISQCTQNMIFYYNFGRMTITHDKRFVTHGMGAAKINAMGDEYIASGAPSFEVVVPKNERDFSKLNKITFDAYNDTDGDYTLGVYFKLNNSKGVKTESKQVTLKKGELLKVSPSFDITLLNIGYDMTDIYAIGFEFNKVGQKYEGKNDVYIDNLRLSKYKTAPAEIEGTLNENEICSFDHLWQTSICFPTSYAAMPGFEMKVSINTDLNYVKKGKSLKLEIPASWAGLNWDWPYLKFSEKYVDKLNLKQYNDNDTLCLWVYSDNDFVVPIDLHFWRKSATEDRSAGVYQVVKGWNLLTWKFGKINEKDLGVGKITEDLSDIRIIFSNNNGRDVKLYFDEFSVIRGE